MTLYIDSTDFNSVSYALKSGNKIVKKVYKINPHESHQALKMFGDFLNKHQQPKSKIQKIIANKGPGSYTGTRMGAAHALALSLAWDVPVKFLSSDKFKIR